MQKMITIRYLIIASLMVFAIELNGQNSGTITISQFVSNPWSFYPNVQNFAEETGNALKMQHYTVKSRSNPAKQDTIFRFYKGKTEIFLYKPYRGIDRFLTANILSDKIKLRENICVGMSRDEFFKHVSIPKDQSNTITVSLPEGAFKITLMFERDLICRIKVEAVNNKKE